MPRSSARPPARRSTDKAPARARLDVADRRTQLLGLGLSLFAERAYDDISIEDIAAAAGVSKGLLYHYFPTKRDFYVAALRVTARQLLEETAIARKAATPEEQVRRGLETYLDFVSRRGAAYVTLMRGGVGSDPEVAKVIEKTRTSFLSRIVEQLPPEVSGPLVRTAMRGWIGFVEATSIDWVARRSVPLADLVDLAQSVLFDSLAATVKVAAHRARPARSRARARR